MTGHMHHAWESLEGIGKGAVVNVLLQCCQAKDLREGNDSILISGRRCELLDIRNPFEWTNPNNTRL